MGMISVSKRIEAAPEAVFEAMTDLRSAEQRISGIKRMEVLTDGAVGVGTRFRETRVLFGKEATEEMEITDFQPGRSYRVEADSCGCHYVTDLEVRPDGTGTNLTFSMATRPNTFMAKIMAPIGVLFQGPMKKMIESDLDDIRKHVEGEGAGAAAPA